MSEAEWLASVNPQVMLACLKSGPHVRGCWVLDLLLGKE